MKLFSTAALLVAIASTANAITVNTPTNVVQCQPILITWDPEGSAGPFFLSVHPGDNPSGPAIVSWDNLTGTSFTWVVSVPAGQSIGLLLRDTTGATSQSAPFPVLAGSTTDCPASSSVSLPPGTSSTVPGTTLTSASPPVSPSPVPTPTTTTSRPLTPSSGASSVRPSTTTSPSPTASGGSGGGALSNAVNLGSAGFLAALVGAVLA